MENWDKAYLQQAHKKSIFNKLEILQSDNCGCFYCLNIYSSSEILEWTDGDRTPLCPYCGIDSVLGDASQFPAGDKNFLKVMHEAYF